MLRYKSTNFISELQTYFSSNEKPHPMGKKTIKKMKI